MTKMTLRALRVNYSLSAKEVAQELGIHQQTLLKYEIDSSKIPVSLLNELADFYEVEVNNIFLGNKYDLNHRKCIHS
ncbi:TPA: helix-turn-helix transcriptional regulator [Streptococcus pyogenes]|uniref:Transcriptional regulator with XRE-family HTH domain n=1 Tax=Streptococcus dysgalactiae TaxID=1334 RepID=A0ABU0A659_STRDY|nr:MULTISPECIES: helix-turn-helix transcriptional regulator [Streptococcus dysgalactiae group]EGL48812.1 DNA-binding helix-turn-helix protein [Streptococcus dysgalactiae subsp. equisimilis SK1249]NSX62711.1 helix-turn-helix transcriptional regulator [Streptococcus pyogenes]QBX14948.1 Cro/CI family transcriptional regulator [Streptococcus phage Javan161]QBX23948.1 Cro/CI family transcriptional regulator [Streptococcus phage Javan170]HEK9097378.1 helix-turn-helix transcriptional regulator [Strep